MPRFRPVLSHPAKTTWVFHEQLHGAASADRKTLPLPGKNPFPSLFHGLFPLSPAPVPALPQFRDLSEQKRQPAANPWPNQLPQIRFLTGEWAALPEQGKHPGLWKRKQWDDSTAGRRWDGAETSPHLSHRVTETAELHGPSPAHLCAEGNQYFMPLIRFKTQRGTQVPAAEPWNASPSALPGLLDKRDTANAI